MDYIRQLARDPDQLWQVLTYLSMFGLILALWFAGIVIWYLRRSRYRDRRRRIRPCRTQRRTPASRSR